MDILYLYLALALLTLFIATIVILRNSKSRVVSTKDLGKAVYIDQGKFTKILISKRYRLKAKPDAIFEKNGEFTGYEFKSRVKGLYPSDIAEAMAAAIVARENGYPITRIRVANKTQYQDIPVPESTEQLYARIAGHVNGVYDARKQLLPTPRLQPKCKGCGHYSQCHK